MANSEDYDHKKGVESSQGVVANVGAVMATGEIKTLNLGAGFQEGLSCGKPTGSIQRNVFWIKRVEYSDGTSWPTDQDRSSKRLAAALR